MEKRPGTEKGRHVPDIHKVKEMLKDPEATKRHAEASAKWVQAQQKADAEK